MTAGRRGTALGGVMISLFFLLTPVEALATLGSRWPLISNQRSDHTRAASHAAQTAGTAFVKPAAEIAHTRSSIVAGTRAPDGVTVSFDDVTTTDPFFTWIEALFRAGITGGCSTNPPEYCPSADVTRGQMAVFLLRGSHGADYQPPAATGTLFNDVPVTHPFAKWIAQFAREGITGGCLTNPPQYCPGAVVTRAQMAVFLLRAKHGAGFQPPAATGTTFADVPVTHPFANWIEQLVREGITGGCSTSPPQYCPDGAVTRGPMAVFLVRAFNLPLPQGQVTSLFPQQGPSGMLVTLTGSGFWAASRVRFGNHEAPVFFVADERLDVIVPFDDAGAALSPAPVMVTVDGTSAMPFEVTPLAANPNPPGQVLSDTLGRLSNAFTAFQPEIDAAIAAVRPVTPDVDVGALLDTLAPLTSTLSSELAQLAQLPGSLSSEFDPLVLDTLERLLLSIPGSPATPVGLSAVRAMSLLTGDDFLDTRQSLVDTLNLFSGLSSLTATACLLMNAPVCGSATVLLALAEYAAELAVKIEAGAVVELEISAPNMVNPTPHHTDVKLILGEPNPVLTAKIKVQRSYGELNPLSIALTKVEWALKIPGMEAGLPDNVIAALPRLRSLVDKLPTFGLLIGQAVSLPVTFSRLSESPVATSPGVVGGCEFGGIPHMTLLESGAVRMTTSDPFSDPPCQLGLKPRFALVSEAGALHEVAFSGVRLDPRLIGTWNAFATIDGPMPNTICGYHPPIPDCAVYTDYSNTFEADGTFIRAASYYRLGGGGPWSFSDSGQWQLAGNTIVVVFPGGFSYTEQVYCNTQRNRLEIHDASFYMASPSQGCGGTPVIQTLPPLDRPEPGDD